MPGTGKSTVTHALRELGFKAVDADDGLTEPTSDGRQRWREAAVQELLDREDAPVLFFAGCEDNMVHFLPRFDHVILLSAPVDTLVERLITRTTNPYGKRPGELDQVLRDVEMFQSGLREIADDEVVTTAPLSVVVLEILRRAGVTAP
jgi:dephospho-CoA kinase